MFHSCRGKRYLAVSLAGLALLEIASAQEKRDGNERKPLALHARFREPVTEVNGQFRIKEQIVRWDPARTAVIICDMWNQHWCRGASRRVAELAPAINRAVRAARAKGVLVIHAPSSCMDPYKDHPSQKTSTECSQGGQSSFRHRRLVQSHPRRGKRDLPDRPDRRRLRRRATLPAGIALEVADRRHRDQRRRRHQRLGRRDLEPAREPGNHQRHAHGRAYEYVRARPAVRFAADGQPRQERRLGSRPDRHHV